MSIQVQKQKMEQILVYLRATKKVVRYGDLLRQGIYKGVINALVKEHGAKLDVDSEGYTIIRA